MQLIVTVREIFWHKGLNGWNQSFRAMGLVSSPWGIVQILLDTEGYSDVDYDRYHPDPSVRLSHTLRRFGRLLFPKRCYGV